MTKGNDSVQVWDILVRIFHWTLAMAFLVAWLSAEELDTLHYSAGYTIAALVTFRVIWGVIGTHYARFNSFVFRWKTVKSYLKEFFSLKPSRYVGHNPAGGLMVILLLISLALVALTGMAMIASDGLGPLAGSWFSQLSGEWIEDFHELLANFTLGLVVFHIAGVVVSSLIHKENLIRAMITGKKKVKEV